MNQLIEKACRNPVAANLLAVLLILIGLASLRDLTVKLFPEINLETISVTVPYPGASPEEVEDAVIEPIEQKVEGLEGVRKITSVASENVGSVLIALVAGENLNEQLNDIQNEIDQITVFPEQSERPIVTIVEPDELALQLIFTGDVDAKYLKQAADGMRRLLIDSEHISDVRIEAAPEYLINIMVSAGDLRAYGLSLTELSAIISQQSLDLSGGEIEGPERRTLIRTLGENKTGEAFSRITVRTGSNGSVVSLGEMATIEDGLSDEPIAGFYDGNNAVVLSAYRVGNEQIFDLVETVEQVLTEQVQPNLPAGVDAFIWRDESSNLEGRINLLAKNALIGIILVSLLLVLFLDIRVAFWVSFGLAVAFTGSFVLLGFTGYTINQLSLFGFILAIGIVVDDAIVVGENIFVRREKGDTAMDAAINGVTHVATHVLMSTLTTVAVFLPLMFIPGIYGQFMGPIAAVVIFVLILSLIEAFFILPRHLSHMSNDEPGKYSPRRWTRGVRKWTSGKLESFTQNSVKKAVNWSVAYPLIIVIAFVSLFILSLGLIKSGAVKFVFFPEIEGNYVTATVELSNNSSEQHTLEVINLVEQRARVAAQQFTLSDAARKNKNAASADGNLSVIDGIFSTRGVKIGGGDPNAKNETGSSSNLAYITVKIEDSATRQFQAVEFEREWRQATGEIPGAKKLIFSSNLVSAGSPVQLEIKSRNEAQAKKVAGLMREQLSNIKGVIDIQDDRFNTTEEIQIKLKPEARNFGVSLSDLAFQIRAAYFGAVAVKVQRDREEIDVRVRLTTAERSTLANFKQQRIKANGGFIPIEAVADISVGQSPASISRKDGKRVITLSADVDNRVITGGQVTNQILKQYWQTLQNRYPGIEVGVGGDQEEQSRAGPAIAFNFALSLFAVYALLALVFASYAQPVVIMFIIPFGFMGALLGHFILGYDLTLLSMFGVIGLSGVVINDGLLLVKFINDKLDEGIQMEQAVTEATLERFRPIILTSLTTFMGVTPIILERSVQAKFLAPTAISLGIGILFATIILILLLPATTMLQLKLKNKFA